MSSALETLISQKQAMEKLNISRTTLWRWRRSGKLISYKLSPRKIGYSVGHIQTLLKTCEERASDGEE